MSLTQLVPQLASPPEGVGTYATALADALRDRFAIASTLLVGDPAWIATAGTNGVARDKVPARTAAALAELPCTTLLLHYANYGYQRRGCPTWLVEGLTRWKGAAPGRRLVTVFHEVYASGAPWNSSFWLGPRQRHLARRVLQLSDASATSLELQAGILHRLHSGAQITVNPVFSTVGEPAEVPPLSARPRRLIVFGGPGARRRAWGELLPELRAACRMLEVEEVWDVGPPVGAPARLEGRPVRELGVLEAAEASTHLLGSCAGFLAYPPHLLGKSTTFAAYCAHGLLPICAWRRPPRHRRGSLVPFWQPRAGTTIDWRELQAIADRAHAWYRGHSLEHHASVYMKLLFPCASADPRPDAA